VAAHCRIEAALSSRERECLEGLARGLDNEKVGRSLGIAVPTVAMHLANARRKLGALTREQAVAIAVARGIVSI
jgi:DNA-binding CsgD family transcriptional regulator